MTNLEWLEEMKKTDDASGEEGVRENLFIYKNEFRQTKALEIIAEELISLKNSILDKSKYEELKQSHRNLVELVSKK